MITISEFSFLPEFSTTTPSSGQKLTDKYLFTVSNIPAAEEYNVRAEWCTLLFQTLTLDFICLRFCFFCIYFATLKLMWHFFHSTVIRASRLITN